MQWFGNYLANLATRFLGPTDVIWFILTTMVAAIIGLAGWHRLRVKGGKPGVQNSHLLLTGIVGTWVFLSLTLGAAAYWIYNGSQGSVTGSGAATQDDGPISWVYNLSMDRTGPQISALRFRGANISKKHVQIKEGSVTSLIDGTRLPLERTRRAMAKS